MSSKLRPGKLSIRTANGEMELLARDIHGILKDRFERSDLYRSCVSCVYFDQERELCKFQGLNQRPPARIIADGCNEYFDDNEIPF